MHANAMKTTEHFWLYTLNHSLFNPLENALHKKYTKRSIKAHVAKNNAILLSSIQHSKGVYQMCCVQAYLIVQNDLVL